MTLAPEVILANELTIPCSGLVVGHKHSAESKNTIDDTDSMTASLDSSKKAMETLIIKFLEQGEPVSFGNRLYRFNDV